MVIDLYKAGVYVSTIASNAPGTGAYQWPVGLGLTPGSDYTIRISSSTNPALFDTSDSPFSIDMPYIVPSSLAVLPGGQFQVQARGARCRSSIRAGLDESRQLAASSGRTPSRTVQLLSQIPRQPIIQLCSIASVYRDRTLTVRVPPPLDWREFARRYLSNKLGHRVDGSSLP